jgi:SAM-dependent methyltransferase
MYIRKLVKKIAFYIPGAQEVMRIKRKAQGTGSARYCYSVWLRYLISINRAGLPFPVESVAELGPGNSLGIGLAAMLSGANKYFAFDIIEQADTNRNRKVFEKLISLFRRRENIPDSAEFPLLKPYMESYDFPKHILTEEYLGETLKQERLESIRKGLSNLSSASSDNIQLRYFVPWNDPDVIRKGSVDMVYSQAVMEHVDDLDFTYKTLNKWLKPKGFMCHQIDFKSHDITREWNGHWRYSDEEWEALRVKKPYLLNREPYSKHIEYMQKNGFKVIFERKIKNASEIKNAEGIKRTELAQRFKDMSDDDLTTSGVFFLATKLR